MPSEQDQALTTAETTTPHYPDVMVDAPVVPGHVIIGEIGCGGMGRVYVGREVALDREVAIKTLLPGANAERFATEAKITAQLPHPGVPPVYALGTLPDGTPYLAMKRIRGRTLAEALKERAGVKEGQSGLVQVFEQVAQAVGFAHARGIIHRDLKPANIMVGEFGEVQVMDWGLARQTDRGSETGEIGVEWASGTGEQTVAGSVLGTPGYMAPEQARGETVDARADVFALGAILAVILTGKPAVVGGNVVELIERTARGELGDVWERLEAAEADGELIGLAKRCLAVRADERPADARAVARAVAAYRGGVEARLRQAETAAAEAQVREGEQRKRRAVWLGLVVTLVVGVVVSTTLAVWAHLARQDAETARWAEARRAESEAKARLEEEEAKKRAEEFAVGEKRAREQTEKRLAQIEKGVQLLAGLMRGIDPRADKKGGDPLYVQLRQKAEQAANQLDEEAVGDPLAMARLQVALGDTLRELGSAARAIDLLRKARTAQQRELGPEHATTLATINLLAYALQSDGQLAESIQLYEEAAAGQTKRFGAEHRATLNTRDNLAGAYQAAGRLAEAVRLFEQVRETKVKALGPDDADTLLTLNNLANAYRAIDRLPEAVTLLEQVRDVQAKQLATDHPVYLTALNNLAIAYQDVGRLADSVRLLQQVVEILKKKLGSEHPSTLSSKNNLAAGYLGMKRAPEAVRLFEQVRDVLMRSEGPNHPTTISTLNNLAEGYRQMGKLTEAIQIYEQVREASKKTLGASHPETLTLLNNLAAAYLDAGRLPAATATFEEALATLEKQLGRQHHYTRTTMSNLAFTYRRAGKMPEAARMFEQLRDANRKKLGPGHRETLEVLHELGQTYRDMGKLTEAIEAYEEARAGRVKVLGPDHPDTLTTLGGLGKTYVLAEQGPKAAAVLKEIVARRRKRPSKGGPTGFAGLLMGIAQDLMKCKEWETAEELLREAKGIWEKSEPNVWPRFHTESMLGGALVGQKKYEEAGPLLLRGYEGLKAREKTVPPAGRGRIAEALERLIGYYEVTNNPEEAARWRKERGKIAR